MSKKYDVHCRVCSTTKTHGLVFRRLKRFLFTLMVIVPASNSLATEMPHDQAGHDTWSNHFKSRLSISAHLSNHRLLDTTRPPDYNRKQTFLGYINELEGVDDPHLSLGIRYRVWSSLTLDLIHDRIAARTMNFNNNLSDGNVVLSGPILSLGLDHPVGDRIWLFAGLGIAFWSGDFEHDAWWTWGWASPEAYERAGTPEYSPTGNRRIIAINDEESLVFTIGMSYRLMKGLNLDLNIRHTEVTAHGQFFGGTEENPIPGARGSFALDNTAYCVGVRYRF